MGPNCRGEPEDANIQSAHIRTFSPSGLLRILSSLCAHDVDGDPPRSFSTHEIVMVGIIEKVLTGNHSHASQIGKNKYVLHSGLISKVNHSCDPNCGISVNGTGAHDFIAMRDIAVHEEITFDYAMRNYGVDYFTEQCGCGSKRCRGKITG